MPVINRSLVCLDNDDDECEALVARQNKVDKKYDTFRENNSFVTGSTVSVQGEERGLWTQNTIVDKEDYKPQ